METVGSCRTSYLQSIIPPEVLLRILGLLQPADKFRLRVTCRRMYAAVSDSAVWSVASFDYYQTANRKALSTILSLCSPGVRKLVIHTRGKIPRFPWVYFTKQISKCASTLSYLSLLGFHPSLEQINTSLADASSLSHLMLEFSRYGDIWFPKVKSLKSFEVCIDSAYYSPYILKQWFQNGCFPSQFMVSSRNHVSLSKWLTEVDLCLRYYPSLLSPHVQGRFLLINCDGPLHVFSRFPYLEVTIKGSDLSVPVAHCSSITTSPLLLVLSFPQCATRIATVEQLPRVCIDTPFSFVASTLVHLLLKGCSDVNSESLNEIACQCPLLEYLCLDSCSSAFNTLHGLSSISKKCLRLKGLNLHNVHGITDQSLFWNLLSSFRQLSYLAIEFCALPVGCSLPERKVDMLISMQVGSIVSSPITRSNCIMCRSVCDRHLTTLGQLMPTNLRVLWMAEQPVARSLIGHGLKDLLCSVPQLQCLSLHSTATLSLPTDSMCYKSIEKVELRCTGFNVTRDFVEALIHCRRLTHCYITVKSISLEAVCTLIQAPRLICCHIGSVTNPSRSWKSQVCKAAKIQGIQEFSAYTYAYTQRSINMDTHPDLRSLGTIS